MPTFALRVSGALLDEARAVADREGIPINKMLVTLIEQGLARRHPIQPRADRSKAEGSGVEGGVE